MIKVDEALKELEEKSYRQIQEETAYKWGARAAASYQMLMSESGPKQLVLWTLAEEYYHEAVEHAALVEDGGEVLTNLHTQVRGYQEKAAKLLDSVFTDKGVDNG